MIQNTKISKLLFILLLLLLQNCKGSKKEELDNKSIVSKIETKIKNKNERVSLWIFDEVFKEPIVPIKDKNTEFLNEEFKNSTIQIKNKKLNFDDKCQFEYIEIKKSFKEYWDIDTEYFINIFKNNNMIVSENTSVIIYKAMFPNEQCEYPASEYILIGNNFYFVKDGFLISFKKSTHLKKEDDIIFLNKVITERLPLKYDLNYIIEEPNFIKVPKNLVSKFKLDYLQDVKIKKLPQLNDLNLYLLIGKNEFGQSNLYLFSLNDKSVVIDSIELYFSEEIGEGKTKLKEFNISKGFIITISEFLIEQNDKKETSTNHYKIDKNGSFIN